MRTRLKQPKDKLLPRLSLAFFDRSRTTAMLWLLIFAFGIVSYTTLLKREGFPSINIPIVVVTGSYAVNDPAKVDSTLAAPISKIALQQAGAKSVQTSSEGNFFNAVVQYGEQTDAKQAKQQLQAAVRRQTQLPPNADLTFNAPYFGITGGSTKKIDATISLYALGDKQSLSDLDKKAQQAVEYLNGRHLSTVDKFFVMSPYQQVKNPLTGQNLTVQRTFDRYGQRSGDTSVFRQSVIIGVSSKYGADAIKLDAQLNNALNDLQRQSVFTGHKAVVSASNAPAIRQSINELQRVLLEGLLAVLIVGSIVIAVRASIITVISMLTVIASTLGLLYLIGYSLNVITLFAVILGLSLIVDDTIIMVEAIDASRKREQTARKVIAEATRKISRAMVAATTTAALSFAPLLFVGGVLGTFVRAIPITIISALLISLLVALIFIPLFARFILLGKKHVGNDDVREVAAGIEHRIAAFLGKPMLWAQHHRKREFTVGIVAVLIGVGFVVAAGFIFTKVTFNIFPPTKDTNSLAVSLAFPAGTSVQQAEATAERADALTSKTLDKYFVDASYYGSADAQSATLYVNLTPYDERKETAPQLVTKLNSVFRNFKGARADVYQLDVGPPPAGFTVNIDATDRAKAEKLAADMAAFLQSHKLTRPSGTQATIIDATVGNTDVYHRTDGQPVISVTAKFDDTDTTTLTTLARQAVKQKYDAATLARYGLQPSAVSFDIGEEQQNQDSFKTLAYAFPLLLFVIYLLLALQFRSLLQPLLIFLAIPFSLFGVTLGLFLTDNPFSFFAMLGFFALIGLSIKNTILLTDYANQARRSGLSPIDAAVAALGERFRPLVATSLTAIVSLIPLALASPFWQGLAVVLIFGLASSTFLVLTVFPYYYLGAEYIRFRVTRRGFFVWLMVNIVVVGGMAVLTKQPLVIGLSAAVLNALLIMTRTIGPKLRLSKS